MPTEAAGVPQYGGLECLKRSNDMSRNMKQNKKAPMGDAMKDQNAMKMDDANADSTNQAPAGDPAADDASETTESAADSTDETETIGDKADDATE